MKGVLLDVMKWGLILIIAGVVLYLVFPKYHFAGRLGIVEYRCNKMTGKVEHWNPQQGWKVFKGKSTEAKQ